MADIPASPNLAKYTEQERGHWRFVDQGVRWTTLGVILIAVSMLLLLLMFIAFYTSSITRNAGANRVVVTSNGVLSPIVTLTSLSCSLLGLFAMMIGLALCSFTPRPLLAKFLALGSLVMLIWSHATFGRAMMMQWNMLQIQLGQRIPGFMGGAIYEQFAIYFTALSEYFLSIILGCCYLLAVAYELHHQELVRSVQGYLKMLFGILLSMLAIGIVLMLLGQSANSGMNWIPIVSIGLIAGAYTWLAYCLVKLLHQLHLAIRTEVEPAYRVPARVVPPPVIDPLAD